MLIQQVEIPSKDVQEALIAYLIENYDYSSIYDKVYSASHENYRNGRFGLVPFELLGKRSLIFKNGWHRFLLNTKDNLDGVGHEEYQGRYHEPQNKSVTITFIRGTLNIDDLIFKACNARNNILWQKNDQTQETARRFTVNYVPSRKKTHDEYEPSSEGLPWYQQANYRLVGVESSELGKQPISSGKALENLVFPAKIKSLIKEIERWCASKDWYRQKNIPWKRGWLLYGPPGTGKTALARAFAEDLDLPIFVFSLAQLSNVSLMRAWAKMQINTPCIALIEDIDNIFHGRENVSRQFPFMNFDPDFEDNEQEDEIEGSDANGSKRMGNAPLTFDCLLNCLDGVEKSDGVFTIITTNDISKIDSALGLPRDHGTRELEDYISTRPGRIDKAIELTYMEPDEMKIMATKILDGHEEELEKMNAFIDAQSLKETPAQFQERCAQIALRCYWEAIDQTDSSTKVIDLRKVSA